MNTEFITLREKQQEIPEITTKFQLSNGSSKHFSS